jgi:hypothetical protein
MAVNKIMASEFAKAAKKTKTPTAMANIEKTMAEITKAGEGAAKGAGRGGLITAKEAESIAKGKKETRALAGEMGKIARESRAFLSKVGLVMKSVALSAAHATQAVAKSSAEAVSQYTNAIKEDININKRNFVAMMLGRSSPIIGYFAAKVFETDIFKRFTSAAKEKVGAAFRKIGGFLRGRKAGAGGIGGAEDMAMIEAASMSAVGPPRLKRHSPGVLEIPLEKKAPAGLEETVTEERGRMSIRATSVTVRGERVTLVGALEKSVQQEQTKIFEKFSKQFGQFSEKQEQQWSMFAWSITGGAPKKGSSFLKDFRTYFSRMIFPSFMSVQDQMLENTIAMRNAIAGPRKKVSTPRALWESLMFVFKRTAFYRYGKMVFTSIWNVLLKPLTKLVKWTGKAVWAPFSWFFFKRFKKFGPENYKLPKLRKGATAAQHQVQMLGALYQGTMYKFDEVIHYLKLMGTAMGAEMKPFARPGFTLYRRVLGPLINKLGVKLIGPIAAKSVTEVSKMAGKGILKGVGKGFKGAWSWLMGPGVPGPGEQLGLPGMRKRGALKRGLGAAAGFISGIVAKIKSKDIKPRSIEEAVVLYSGKTASAVTGLLGHFKEKARKERIEKLREKGKGLFKKILGWITTAFGMLKTFISNTIGTIVPKLIGGLSSVLTNPGVLKALGSAGAVIGAGVVGYQVGKYLNTWLNKAVKKFTGENTLGEWAASQFQKHPIAKRIWLGMATGGLSELYGWFKRRAERNRVATVRQKYYQAKMSASAYSLMGDLSKMGIEEMAQKFVTLREEGSITKKGGKWVTLDEAAKIALTEKPPTHIGKEMTARIATGYDRMREADLKKIWEEYAGKTGETWEDFKKRFGPMIAQSTQSVIQNTQNISNFIQQQGGRAVETFDRNLDQLISNEAQ